MPDIAAALRLAPVAGLQRTADLPQDALGGGDLIGPHDQQRLASYPEHLILLKYRLMRGLRSTDGDLTES